jgi:hypothetical protein
MNDIITMGIRNHVTASRGIIEGMYAPTTEGGRGIPHIRREFELSTLRIISRTLAAPEVPKYFILEALHQPRHHKLNFFAVVKTVLNSLEIQIREPFRPTINCAGYPTQPLGCKKVCVDASRRRNLGEEDFTCQLGIAHELEDGSLTGFSVKLSSDVGDSYTAEACGVALLANLGYTSPIINDNQGLVRHVERVRQFSPHWRQRAAITNHAIVLTNQVALSQLQLSWVKGHVDPAQATPEERLNAHADSLSRSTAIDFQIEVTQLSSLSYHSLWKGRNYFNTVHHPNAITLNSVMKRVKEVLLLTGCERDKSVVLFYLDSKSRVCLPALVVNTILAIRNRAVIPKRVGYAALCACGYLENYSFHHCIFECTHETHERHYGAFHTILITKYGPGWWAPDPPVRYTDPLLSFSPTHLIYGFAQRVLRGLEDDTLKSQILKTQRCILTDWSIFIAQRIKTSALRVY